MGNGDGAFGNNSLCMCQYLHRNVWTGKSSPRIFGVVVVSCETGYHTIYDSSDYTSLATNKTTNPLHYTA